MHCADGLIIAPFAVSWTDKSLAASAKYSFRSRPAYTLDVRRLDSRQTETSPRWPGAAKDATSAITAATVSSIAAAGRTPIPAAANILEVIFAEVEKRPRITTFDEFGPRLPSDRPPIKTPGELAIERGEPWPPPESLPGGRISNRPGRRGVGLSRSERLQHRPRLSGCRSAACGHGRPRSFAGAAELDRRSPAGPLAPLPGWQQPGPTPVQRVAPGQQRRASGRSERRASRRAVHALRVERREQLGAEQRWEPCGRPVRSWSRPDQAGRRSGARHRPAVRPEENGQPPVDPWAPPRIARR